VAYKNLERFILSVLIIYPIVGAVSLGRFHNEYYPYPFFSWSLYSLIPNTFHSYDLRFFSYKGQTYEQSVSYKEFVGNQISQEKGKDLFFYVSYLGRSIARDKEARVLEAREMILKILGEGEISYEVIEIEYDPLDGDRTIKSQNLGKFSEDGS